MYEQKQSKQRHGKDKILTNYICTHLFTSRNFYFQHKANKQSIYLDWEVNTSKLVRLSRVFLDLFVNPF